MKLSWLSMYKLKEGATMKNFEEMYNHLTSIIRANASYENVKVEIQATLEAYPSMKSQLFARLDAAFGQHGEYKTARAAFEQGRTYFVREFGDPSSSEIHPDAVGKFNPSDIKGRKL
jgi:hypothetical protein